MGKRVHDQPLIRAMKAVFDGMDWITMTRPLEDEKFL
jgi:hypothetical protein